MSDAARPGRWASQLRIALCPIHSSETPAPMTRSRRSFRPSSTISFHYGKHHKAYVDKLNELVPGTAYEDLSLEDVVKKSAKDEKGKAIFNNAGQIWNHNFYWNSAMTPKGGRAGQDQERAGRQLWRFDAFKAAFKAAACRSVRQRPGFGWSRAPTASSRSRRPPTLTPMAHGMRLLLSSPTCGSTPTTLRLPRSPAGSHPGVARHDSRTGRSPGWLRPEQSMLGTILPDRLILILIRALPTWPHSSGWGFDRGRIGLVLIIVIILLLMGRIALHAAQGAPSGAFLTQRQYLKARLNEPSRNERMVGQQVMVSEHSRRLREPTDQHHHGDHQRRGGTPL